MQGGRAAVTAQYFEDQKNVLARMAQRPGIRRLDPAQCDPIVKTYPELHPEFTNLTLRRPNGDLLCSYLPHAVQHMKPEALHAFGFSPGAPTQSTSNVFTGPTSGRKLVGTTQKVLAESGGEPGFLLLGNDLLKLNERIFAGLPQDVTIGIFDRTETLVFRSSEPDKWIGQPIAPANRGKYNVQPEGQAVITAIDGVRRMYAWTTIPGLDWRVSAGVPEAQALGPYWQVRNTVAGAVALLLLAALALAYRLAQSINRPVRALAEVTHHMVDGDFSTRAAVSGSRELRTLATAPKNSTVSCSTSLPCPVHSVMQRKTSHSSTGRLFRLLVIRCKTFPAWRIGGPVPTPMRSTAHGWPPSGKSAWPRWWQVANPLSL